MSGAAPAHLRRGVLAASLAVFVGAADTYVVVTILPAILAATGLDLTQLNQAAPIVTGFLAGYVCALPLLGRLSDLHGRIPTLFACLLLFALGSVTTGSANDLWQVVLGRTLQGAGGGGLVPVTLAMVADGWPAERRGLALGGVGAAQELGSVVGPLYGAALAAAGGWRAVFYVNLPLTGLLAAGVAPRRPRRGQLAVTAVGATALLCALLAISAPPALAGDATIGTIFTPLVAGVYATSPLALLALALGGGLTGWALRALRRRPGQKLPVDWPGAGLAGAGLAMLVLTFAGADPSRSIVAPQAPLLLTVGAAAATLFVLRELHTPAPLVDLRALGSAPALGALGVNLAVGVALIAALVDVPVLARATVAPDSQLGAALVLTRLLVAVPVGALLGGLWLRRLGHAAVAAAGMGLGAASLALMSTWDAAALSGRLGVSWLHPSDPVLAACGLGFGLAIAPVSAAILAAVPAAMHGVAASLTVAARILGMLAGLSLLTAIGLQRFTAVQATLPSPLALCPHSPLNCPALDALETAALLDEVHVIFLGAAAAALVATLVALLLRSPRRATLWLS
ncbi:MAG: MFS transporter [Candidatus Dormibacteria bacterium]